jgi:hypothetical protein
MQEEVEEEGVDVVDEDEPELVRTCFVKEGVTLRGEVLCMTALTCGISNGSWLGKGLDDGNEVSILMTSVANIIVR